MLPIIRLKNGCSIVIERSSWARARALLVKGGQKPEELGWIDIDERPVKSAAMTREIERQWGRRVASSAGYRHEEVYTTTDETGRRQTFRTLREAAAALTPKELT